MTSTALTSIRKLRRLAAVLEAGEQPDPGDGAWLADRLARYLDGASEHPDERGQKGLEQIRECESLQGIDRIRLVHRDHGNPPAGNTCQPMSAFVLFSSASPSTPDILATITDFRL